MLGKIQWVESIKLVVAFGRELNGTIMETRHLYYIAMRVL
jgi:hypothetical protein